MGQIVESELAERGGEIMPIRANDPPLVVAAHKVWNRMAENHSLDVKRACEETGVPRWQFYKALKSEVVQNEIAQWLGVMRSVEAKLLRDNWFSVLTRQIEIASGRDGDPRTSVQAARFLDGVRQGIEELNPGKPEGEKTAAALFLKSIKQGKATYRAQRRTKTGPGETVTEELAVEGVSGGNEGLASEG